MNVKNLSINKNSDIYGLKINHNCSYFKKLYHTHILIPQKRI